MTEARGHRPPQLNLLREVQRDSPVHRLWAGTKILIVLALSVTLSYFPSWGAIAVVSAVLVGATLLARVPGGAWPRPPRWFWLVMVVTGALAAMAGGKPHVTVAGVRLGLGGIDAYGRFVLVGVLLLLAALVLGWTTPLGDIAPALARLMSPLRLVRFPVDEAATAVALCVRSLPLIVGDVRTLVAARRLRPPPGRQDLTRVERLLDEAVDLMVAALAVSTRRAGDMAEAITARGGSGIVTSTATGWRPTDLFVLVAIGAICWLSTLFPV
jgi:energy-coupling factor transport system permease protein